MKICRVKGLGRLQFTCHPCTSWSFSFYDVWLHTRSQYYRVMSLLILDARVAVGGGVSAGWQAVQSAVRIPGESG